MLISTHGHESSSAAQNMLTPGAQRSVECQWSSAGGGAPARADDAARGPGHSLMVLPKRRGVLMRISWAIQSQLFFCSSCPCMRANVPGFSSLKNERAVARMKSWRQAARALLARARQTRGAFQNEPK